MSTTTKERTASEQKIIDELRRLDFDLWFERALIGETRKKLEKELAFKIPPGLFKELREETCKWWKTEPRRKPTANMLLDASGWEILRAAVSKRLADIQERSIDEAVAVVRIECPCNRKLLEGLNSDLRVWNGERRKVAH